MRFMYNSQNVYKMGIVSPYNISTILAPKSYTNHYFLRNFFNKPFPYVRAQERIMSKEKAY